MALKSKTKGDDDDDGESAFMPLEEVLRKLKAGALNFGVYQTGDKDNPVLMAAHKRKNPTVLGKKCKKEAGTTKGAFGVLSLESDMLTFQCENDDAPASLKKRIRVMLKNAGYAKFKPRILLPGGVELGDDDDEGEVIDAIIGAAGNDGAGDEEARKEAAHQALVKRAGQIENAIYDANIDEANPGLLQDLQAARGAAHDERFAEAKALLDKVDQDLKTAMAARPTGGKDAALAEEVNARWAEADPILATLIDAGDSKVAGQAAKLAKLMQTTLAAGDYKKAKGALVVVERFIENALDDIGDADGSAGDRGEAARNAGTGATPAAAPSGQRGGSGRSSSTAPPSPGGPRTGATPPPAGPRPGTTPPPAAPRTGTAAPTGAPAVGPAPRPAASPGGAPPVTADENARLAAMSPEELAKADLTIGNTKALFTEDYMLKLKDAPTRGAGDPKLKDLMREIEKGVSGPRRAEVMQALAQIVGNPPTAEKLDLDYGRFLVVRDQQKARGKGKEEVPGLDEGMHPDFRGSRSQLLFGKVLGDAFGIHEVFAALLSPTGGLVGPGNWLIEGKVKAGHLDPDNPVALHGTVHDAAGYLTNYHGEGPGYNYRESDIEILGTDNPLSGQISGIAYWAKEAGPEYVEKRVDAAVVAVEKKLKAARDAVEAEIEKKMAEARKLADKGVKAAGDVADAAKKTLVGVGDAISDAASQLRKSGVEAFEDGAKKVGQVADTAQRKLDAAWDFIWN